MLIHPDEFRRLFVRPSDKESVVLDALTHGLGQRQRIVGKKVDDPGPVLSLWSLAIQLPVPKPVPVTPSRRSADR